MTSPTPSLLKNKKKSSYRLSSTSALMMETGSSGRSPRSVRARSMACTTPAPLTTRPNTVCLLSSQGVGAVVMKNWEPLVFGPGVCFGCLFAGERENGEGGGGWDGRDTAQAPKTKNKKSRPLT